MRNNNLRYIISILLAVLVVFSLAACGSGGGGGGGSAKDNNSNSGNEGSPGPGPVTTSTVSGVSATGDPIAGGHVFLKDSIGNNIDRETTTNAAGVYTVDVTGLTSPYFLRISWTDTISGEIKDLYSVTTDPSGTANINELTNAALVVAIAKAGINLSDPKAIFDNSDSYVDEVETNLAGAINDLLDFLAPVLSDPHFNAVNINPLTDYFEANGKGLDKVILDGDIVLTPDGKLIFMLNGENLGEADLYNLENPGDPITASDVEAALTVVSVSGSGVNSAGSILTFVNVNSVPLGGTVTYYDALPRLNFASTSITGVSEAAGTVTITGEGSVTDISQYVITGYTFTATVTNGTANIQLHSPQAVINGSYNVAGASVSGSGVNSAGSILTFVNVNSAPLGGTVTYYDALPRLNFASTSITGVSEAAGTVTITGEGSVTDISQYVIGGYTFTATVTNGTANIQLHSPQAVINGSYNVTIP